METVSPEQSGAASLRRRSWRLAESGGGSRKEPYGDAVVVANRFIFWVPFFMDIFFLEKFYGYFLEFKLETNGRNESRPSIHNQNERASLLRYITWAIIHSRC